VKKTKALALPKLLEGFGNSVFGQAVMVEQIMRDDKVPVAIAHWAAIIALHIDLVAAGVLARHLLSGEEDVVIIPLRAQRPRPRIIIPFLDEQHAGLRAGMRFEAVGVQPNDREHAGALHDEIAHPFIAGIVEPPLRQDNRHPPAGPQHIQIALDKEDISANRLLALSGFTIIGQIIFG
jgi:hypothetical protein